MRGRFATAIAGILLAGCASASSGFTPAGPARSTATPAEIIARYAADYASDPYNDRAATFGVTVDGQWWTVDLAPGVAARVTAGQPSSPTFYFVTDAATLARIDAGSMNSLTAMAKAKASDAAPMDLGFMDGFVPPDDLIDWALPLIFHFWTAGQPEIIPFTGDVTRTTHGADMGIFYYQPGFRSGFFRVQPGQHVNEDPADRVNPFPSLIIVQSGKLNAHVGGRTFVLKAGEAMLVPPGVEHHFTNEFGEAGEGFLLMFGDGA